MTSQGALSIFDVQIEHPGEVPLWVITHRDLNRIFGDTARAHSGCDHCTVVPSQPETSFSQ